MNKGQYQLILGIIVLTTVAVSIGIIYYFSIKPVGLCGWCGDTCQRTFQGIKCPAILPPAGYECLEVNGECMIRAVTTTTSAIVQPECIEGSYRCTGKNLERCASGKWQFVQSCPYDCLTDHCISVTTTTTTLSPSPTTTTTVLTTTTTTTSPPSILAPNLVVGNMWSYSGWEALVSGNTTYNETRNVTKIEKFQEKNTYVLNYSYTNNLQWLDFDWHILKDEKWSGTSVLRYTYTPDKKWYDFPLILGKEWNATYNVTQDFIDLTDPTKNRSSAYDLGYYFHVKVVGLETITVPAGTFDAYVLEYNYTQKPPLNATYTWYKYWFSEKVKGIVKEVTYGPPYYNESSIFSVIELTSYTLV